MILKIEAFRFLSIYKKVHRYKQNGNRERSMAISLDKIQVTIQMKT